MQYKTRKSNLKIVIIVVALIAFGTVFLLTGALLTAVYGFKPGDKGFEHYKNAAGQDNTPFEDIVRNGCITEETLSMSNENQYVLDSKDLSEFGNILIGPDLCIKMAMDFVGYKISSIEPYGEEDNMKITLVKKP